MNSKLSVVALVIGVMACAGVSWSIYQQSEIMALLGTTESTTTHVIENKPIINDNSIFKLANSQDNRSTDIAGQIASTALPTMQLTPSQTINLNQNDPTILIKQKLFPQLVDLFALTKPNEQIKITLLSDLYLVEISTNNQKVSFFTNQDASLLIPVRSVLKMTDGLSLLKKSLTIQTDSTPSISQSNASFDSKPSLTDDQLALNGFVNYVADKSLYKKLISLAIEYPSFGPTVGEFVVFFDPECSSCREFYPKIKKLQAAGFTVRLALIPLDRSSRAQTRLLYALCDKDPKAKIDDMVHDNPIFAQNTTCANPIPDAINISKQIKLKGTPWVMLPDGRSGDIRILRTYINAVVPDRKQEALPKTSGSGNIESKNVFDEPKKQSKPGGATFSLNTSRSSNVVFTPNKNVLPLEASNINENVEN